MVLNPVEIRQREVCEKLQDKKYPQVNQIVQNDIYVDDCLSGEENIEKSLQKADEQAGVEHGNLILKGMKFIWGNPTSVLSADDSSIIMSFPYKFHKFSWRASWTLNPLFTVWKNGRKR